MSDLSINPAGNGPVHALRNVPSLSHHSTSGVDRASRLESAPAGDRVELSNVAQYLAKMRDMPDVRQDRIDRVREAISRGSYETDARLEQAIERLIGEEDLLGA